LYLGQSAHDHFSLQQQTNLSSLAMNPSPKELTQTKTDDAQFTTRVHIQVKLVDLVGLRCITLSPNSTRPTAANSVSKISDYIHCWLRTWVHEVCQLDAQQQEM
jgi:hypothetical protein